MKYMHTILALLIATILFADTITLKSGVTVKGDIIAIESDTVTIQAKTGELKIPTVDIEEIVVDEEEEEKEREEEKETTEESQVHNVRILNNQAVPTSIKQVGCGCLGAIIGGSAATILAVTTDGFGGSGDATTIIIFGSIIVGVIVGFATGGG